MYTVRLVRMALLVALSVAGASLKIPALTGTPALDSAPGYFAALALGAGEGAVVAAAGHLATALTAGFPLSVAIHLLIALGMAGCAAAVARVARRLGHWWGCASGVILNGLVFPALFTVLPGFGLPFFAAMVAPLLVASALNLGLAGAAYEVVVRARVWAAQPRATPGGTSRPGGSRR